MTSSNTSSPSRKFSTREVFQFTTGVDVVYMTIGGIGAFLTGVSVPLFNVLFGEILDNLNEDGSDLKEGVNQVAKWFAIIAAIDFFTGLAQVYCWTVVGERQTQKLREQYVQSILRQEIGWFDLGGASELSTKVTDLCGKVQDGVGRKLSDCIQYFFQILGAFIVAFYLSWRLTLVLLVCFPAIAGAGYFMISAVSEATTNSLSQYAKAGGLATECLNAIRTVSSLNLQPFVIHKYREYLINAMNVGIYKGYRVGLGNGLLFCTCFFCYALAFWYGSSIVADDVRDGCTGNSCQTGGSIMACFFSVLMGSIAMGQISPPIGAFFTAVTAAQEILDLCERKPEIDGLSTEGFKPPQPLSGKIQFKDISFSYPARPDTKVCDGFTLDIEPGETVAICGASGSGKSTAANLLLRFYDPQDGVVIVDGIDVKTYNSRWLRSQIGYVGQEPYLFAGTIADNIRDGIDLEVCPEMASLSPEKIQERVVAAAKMANAHEFIMDFPNGYDTDVGSNGVSMSGGQKQRIAIARALVKNPPILLFDEATSALDTASEQLVQSSIDALQRDRSHTTVVIAHRLSTIRGADKIALLHEGKIAEQGTHDELIATSTGKYSELVRMQMHSDEEYFDGEDTSRENEKGNYDVTQDSAAEETDKLVTAYPVAVEAKVCEESTDDVKEEEKAAAERASVSKRMWHLVMQHKLWLGVGLFGAMVYGATFPVWGLLLARAQNAFYHDDASDIEEGGSEVAIQFLGLGIVCLVSCTLEFWGIAHVGEKLSAHIRSDMFESLLHRGIPFFDQEENSSGILISRLAEDSRIVHKATGEAVAKQLQALFTLLIGLGIGYNASWKIASVVIATFPLNIIASAVQMQAVAGAQHNNSTKVDESHAALIASAFIHMRTVSSLSIQYRVSQIYNEETRKIASLRKKRAWIAGAGFGGSQLSLFATYALLFWYGAQLIDNGEIDFIDLMTAIMSLMLGTMGLGMAMTDMGDQKEGAMAASRIFKTIDSSGNDPQDGLSLSGKVPTEFAKGDIEFRNVSFSYPSRKDVKIFKNLNLKVNAGETVALVGPSGSGKSSVISMLLRFYDPDEGEIFLDGINIKDYNIRWLRGQFGYVGQEPVLFSGTVAENIKRGRYDPESSQTLVPDSETFLRSQEMNCFGKSPSAVSTTSAAPITGDKEAAYKRVAENKEDGDVEIGNVRVDCSTSVDDDILKAAHMSNAHDFVIRFPNGYDTQVGEGSIMISGGQKQRIAIARAIVKQPNILLLDEATSALDAAAERQVQDSIDSLQSVKSHTSIIVAHRLTTINNADNIVVIEKGEVVESGTHQSLLQKDKVYAKLWNRQQGRLRLDSEENANINSQATSLK